jgi:N-acyl-phosphatidylethanolamine-hydrolysing phospholipase D
LAIVADHAIRQRGIRKGSSRIFFADDELVSDTSPAHHRPGGGFRNPWPGSAPRGFSGVLRWMYDRATHPRAGNPASSEFPRVRSSIVAPRATADTIGATWVGHSTVFVQLGAANILTDPMWSERASPVAFAGPRRIVPAAVSLDALPSLDLVLLSHNHYDHLDDATVRALTVRHPEVTWVVPLGVASFVRARGARHVVELDWWQTTRIADVEVTCAPAQHFSGRSISDRDLTLWCSWCVRSPSLSLYFGGDSAYHPEYPAIASRCGPFDVVLLPIGAYEPRWFMRTVHMNAEEAVRSYLDLVTGSARRGRTIMVPIHWGTFKLTDEPLDEPPARLIEAWHDAGLPREDLWLLRHGESRQVTIGT